MRATQARAAPGVNVDQPAPKAASKLSHEARRSSEECVGSHESHRPNYESSRLTGDYRLLSTTTATAERLPQPDSVPQQQQGTPARTSAPYTTREELPARTDGKRDSRRKRRADTPGPRSRGDRARRRANAFGRTRGREKRETSTAGPPHEAECEAERAGSAGELRAPPSRGYRHDSSWFESFRSHFSLEKVVFPCVTLFRRQGHFGRQGRRSIEERSFRLIPCLRPPPALLRRRRPCRRRSPRALGAMERGQLPREIDVEMLRGPIYGPKAKWPAPFSSWAGRWSKKRAGNAPASSVETDGGGATATAAARAAVAELLRAAAGHVSRHAAGSEMPRGRIRAFAPRPPA